jgi:hypothetical protein
MKVAKQRSRDLDRLAQGRARRGRRSPGELELRRPATRISLRFRAPRAWCTIRTGDKAEYWDEPLGENVKIGTLAPQHQA